MVVHSADDIKQKRTYDRPETKEDAIRLLTSISARAFAKLKGKGLTILESSWDKSDSRLEPTKSLYNSMVAEVCNTIKKEVEDCLQVLHK